MERLQLFKARDIGTVISDTIEIMKKETNLMKWVYTYLLPAYAVVGVIVGIATKDITGLYGEMVGDILKGGFDENSLKEAVTKMQGINQGAVSGLSSLGGIASLILSAIIASLTYNYMKSANANGSVSEGEAQSFLTKDMGWYIGYSILLGLTLGLGFVVLIVLAAIGFAAGKAVGAILMIVALLVGLYFLLRYSMMFMPVCFMENLNFGDALRRGSQLVSTNFWGTIGLSLLLGLIIGIGSSVVSSILGAIGSALGDTAGSVLMNVGQNVFGCLGGVASGIAMSLWYGNLCNRSEGTTSSTGGNLIDEIGQKDGNDLMNKW